MADLVERLREIQCMNKMPDRMDRSVIGRAIDEIERLEALANPLPETDRERVMRHAIKNLLPIGNPRLPDDRVFPIYVRMSELRALHELVASPSADTLYPKGNG